MKLAVYPGSFDPVTNGHLDIIKRASKLCDKLVVAVLINSKKTSIFSIEERVSMIEEITKCLGNVEVTSFSGLLMDFCRQKNANVVIKGLRAVSDFEYEFQMALTNKQLYPEVETVFLTAALEQMYLSSTIVREVAKHGGNIDQFVPTQLIGRVKKAFEAR